MYDPSAPGPYAVGVTTVTFEEVPPVRLRISWIGLGVVALVVAGLLGVALGPVSINPWRTLQELADHIGTVREVVARTLAT